MHISQSPTATGDGTRRSGPNRGGLDRGPAPMSRATADDGPRVPPVARLEQVAVRLGAARILEGLDLEVAAGEAVGLVGPNGSGKTTLLRLLATLLAPSAGTGQVLGATLGSEETVRVRPHITLIGHVPGLQPRLTLEENLRLVARLADAPTGRVCTALEAVGLAAAGERPARHCSQGMLRRADLARALITHPALLLLDEAHAGLDAASAGLIELLVAEVTARPGSAVVVSHQPERLAGVVDRMVILEAGRVTSVEVPR